jgi:YfiH family protein
LRNGQRTAVRNRDEGGRRADRDESSGGTAVKLEARRSSASDDLDVAPQHTVRSARAERFHGGLLGGESSCEMDRRLAATPAIGDLGVGKNPVFEPLTVPGEGVADAIDFDGVEAEAADFRHDEWMADPQPSGGFTWVQHSAAPALICRPLGRVASHLYTTRAWMLGSRSADPVLAWRQVAQAAGVASNRLVHLRQVHGSTVATVRRGEALSPSLPEADIIATDDPELAIAIQMADCTPILIADRVRGVVAAAHAGWRGLAGRVPDAAIAALERHWGSRPDDLVAAIGPSIGACCYEVGADVRIAFENAGFEANQIAGWFGPERRPRHWHFDGWKSAADQLMTAGLTEEQIHVARLCTGCHPVHFSSYRREGASTGRMVAVIRPAPLCFPLVPRDRLD